MRRYSENMWIKDYQNIDNYIRNSNNCIGCEFFIYNITAYCNFFNIHLYLINGYKRPLPVYRSIWKICGYLR